jgi:hypothetical protein
MHVQPHVPTFDVPAELHKNIPDGNSFRSWLCLLSKILNLQAYLHFPSAHTALQPQPHLQDDCCHECDESVAIDGCAITVHNSRAVNICVKDNAKVAPCGAQGQQGRCAGRSTAFGCKSPSTVNCTKSTG